MAATVTPADAFALTHRPALEHDIAAVHRNRRELSQDKAMTGSVKQRGMMIDISATPGPHVTVNAS